jgi:hypothetical protein
MGRITAKISHRLFHGQQLRPRRLDRCPIGHALGLTTPSSQNAGQQQRKAKALAGDRHARSPMPTRCIDLGETCQGRGTAGYHGSSSEQPMATPQCGLGMLALGLVLAGAAPGWAGSGTAESIISRQDAIAQASAAMPASDQITNTRCIDMIRDLSSRYRCTVQWGTSAP